MVQVSAVATLPSQLEQPEPPSPALINPSIWRPNNSDNCPGNLLKFGTKTPIPVIIIESTKILIIQGYFHYNDREYIGNIIFNIQGNFYYTGKIFNTVEILMFWKMSDFFTVLAAFFIYASTPLVDGQVGTRDSPLWHCWEYLNVGNISVLTLAKNSSHPAFFSSGFDTARAMRRKFNHILIRRWKKIAASADFWVWRCIQIYLIFLETYFDCIIMASVPIFGMDIIGARCRQDQRNLICSEIEF